MPDNYILLERTELNASAASVTFASIPQSGYTDLKIVQSARISTGSQASSIIRFNGITTGYSSRYLLGAGSAGTASGTSTEIFVDTPADSTYTANSFSNSEIYIPNYAGSTNKSLSVDIVNETNGTVVTQLLVAGLWSNTAAINSIQIVAGAGSFVAGSTFSLYGIAAVGTTPVIAPKAIGGNIIDFDGTNWIHTFTTSGTFTPLQGLSCDVLVVAGGGGGGYYFGSGGGAGGLLEQTSRTVASLSYPITIGGGGAKSPVVAGLTKGADGTNSVFDTITALGGGGGNGGDNGSGGAGGNTQSTAGGSSGGKQGGTASAATQGNSGGATGYGFAGSVNASGGGGGGAGAVGSGQNGGAGRANSITGTSITYAGGGGGQGGTNGTGGGSTVNRGGGGKGDTENGGSGIVIIRYPA
jgi:hypothetical protein